MGLNKIYKQSFTLCIPTLNPGKYAKMITDSILIQSFKPSTILIIDSSSDDGSLIGFQALSPQIIKIERGEFDHGGTRNLAFEKSSNEIVIFLTQDAILANTDSLEQLYNSINKNPALGLVYGRQLPTSTANPFAAHARLFNYPKGRAMQIKSAQDISRLGIKTVFCSNSFAAYRRSVMERIGFFPVETLFAEDALAAAKLIREGGSLGYEPRACVYHSHNYTLKQEFQRYFDVGACHSMNSWFLDYLGSAEGEGMRFVKSELSHVRKFKVIFPFSQVLLKNGIRFMGYRLGKLNNKLPFFLNQLFSMNKSFWKKNRYKKQ